MPRAYGDGGHQAHSCHFEPLSSVGCSLARTRVSVGRTYQSNLSRKSLKSLRIILKNSPLRAPAVNNDSHTRHLDGPCSSPSRSIRVWTQVVKRDGTVRRSRACRRVPPHRVISPMHAKRSFERPYSSNMATIRQRHRSCSRRRQDPRMWHNE